MDVRLYELAFIQKARRQVLRLQSDGSGPL